MNNSGIAISLVRVFPKILTNHRADMAVPLLLERALGKNGKNEPTKLWIDSGLAIWTMSHHCMRITCPVWCLRNSYTFVALKLAWGEARDRKSTRLNSSHQIISYDFFLLKKKIQQ